LPRSDGCRHTRHHLAPEIRGSILAHELSQPLTAITAYARGCLRLLAGSAPEPAPAPVHEGLMEVVQQAERAGDVLDRLREFLRGGEFRRALTEVKPLVDAAVSLTRTEAMQQQVEIKAKIDPGLPAVLADRVQIEQVLLNLRRNAMDAMEAANTERRSIVIEARRNSEHAIEISVADSGPGVAAEVTVPGRSSSSMCRQPRRKQTAMLDKSVFVVDDDAAVRQGLRFMLRAAGYCAEAFPSAPLFLEDYDPRRGGCLLLDVRMPQMTGLELQQQNNVRGWRASR
jgi:response regulator receiver domain-containing protein/histidine kinase/DNA gyrase B/HSP90-like ATPase